MDHACAGDVNAGLLLRGYISVTPFVGVYIVVVFIRVRLPSKTLQDRGHSRTYVVCHKETLSRCSKVGEQRCGYSITSSARASTDGGTSRPSALAVFALITSSNLVGCVKLGRRVQYYRRTRGV